MDVATGTFSLTLCELRKAVLDALSLIDFKNGINLEGHDIMDFSQKIMKTCNCSTK